MSNKCRKICVVITARASYARIKTVLEAINGQAGLELQLVVAGSALLERYGPVIDVIRKDGFNPSSTVYMQVEGENLVTSAKSTGAGIVELATVFDNLSPDMVLSIADRYETIATAIAASYLNIPVVHVQGGEVTGSIDEKVRHAVTKLANLHFVSNQQAAERVIRMGEDPETVFITGCPSIDLAARIMKEEEDGFDVYGVAGGSGVGHTFDMSEGFLVVMQHPVTTEHDAAAEQVEKTLHAIHHMEMPTFWFWPNVDAGSDAVSAAIRRYREAHDPDHIYFLKNLSPENFLRLLKRSRCIIGNSSVGIRECSFMGVPTVNIGSRQKRRERAENVIDVTYDEKAIIGAIEKHLANGKFPSSELYGDGDAGKRIVEILTTIELGHDKQIAY
ncbi:MAG: UDP-N-acetylglucosamine 2-epimerase [Kiritimatiellia bacterium]|jgi:UDP-hydrolysing UDP-N-acetyl-D-glucosamine 2-epimerase|nr:UDP-N-acetylglucosamine 2-epimerase [Kiritimatiellia bacterium]MDP6781632.1 UDP-N-acetylglucosamine 2-epimerase [Alphaproteobacteria bacterium]|tara:strand:- start:2364 stop:3533 length:1170 start_codon:yes stop_codon:yes gene_type:complete